MAKVVLTQEVVVVVVLVLVIVAYAVFGAYRLGPNPSIFNFHSGFPGTTPTP